MSKQIEILEKTGRYTQEERATYTLHYKFDLGERFVYIDQEAFDGKVGNHFTERKDGKAKMAGSFTLDGRGFDSQDIKSFIAKGSYEKGEYEKVIEYEADYE